MQIAITLILFGIGLIFFLFEQPLLGAIIATLGILSFPLITLGIWIYNKLF